MAGRGMKKVTEYGAQLQEKQKAKQMYGLRERQFERLYLTASKDKAQTGQTLLRMLESRVDNVLYRAGVASTRSQARQLISHRHFMLNGRRISIPSIAVNPGDKLEPYKIKGLEFKGDGTVNKWLTVDKKALKVTVERLPEGSELPLDFDTQKIVQFYSR